MVMHSPPNAMFVLIHLGVGESRALSAKHDAHRGPSPPRKVLNEVSAENVVLVHEPIDQRVEKTNPSLGVLMRVAGSLNEDIESSFNQ